MSGQADQTVYGWDDTWITLIFPYENELLHMQIEISLQWNLPIWGVMTFLGELEEKKKRGKTDFLANCLSASDISGSSFCFLWSSLSSTWLVYFSICTTTTTTTKNSAQMLPWSEVSTSEPPKPERAPSNSAWETAQLQGLAEARNV